MLTALDGMSQLMDIATNAEDVAEMRLVIVPSSSASAATAACRTGAESKPLALTEGMRTRSSKVERVQPESSSTAPLRSSCMPGEASDLKGAEKVPSQPSRIVAVH